MSLGGFLPLQFFWNSLRRISLTLFLHVCSVVKNPPANAGDLDLTPVLGRPSGEGNGNPLQYFLA